MSAFIVFEGGEGSGKTSAITGLDAVLRDAGHDVLLTREPGGTPEGMQLRSLLLAADGPPWDPGAELLLMTAARVQHVQRVIRPALESGKIVLCDRFLGSSLAYQGAGRGLPTDLILDLHRRFVGDVYPNLTLLLDVEPRIGLARSARRLAGEAADESRFEELALSFHTRVRAAFLAQAENAQKAVRVVSAAGDQSTVQEIVNKIVLDWLNQEKQGSSSFLKKKNQKTYLP